MPVSDTKLLIGLRRLLRRVFSGSLIHPAVLLLAMCTALPPSPVWANSAQAPEILRLTDEVLAQVSTLRGLSVLKPIGRELHSEASMRSYIAQRLREEYPGDRLEREQRLLAALGLLPAGFDLGSAVERLYSSQTAGYYDPQKKMLYLSESLPASLQMPTLAHELTHALQDQHFRIGDHMKPDRERRDDDHQLALMGFLEGDATAVMLAVLSGAQNGDSWTEALELLQSDILDGLAAITTGTTPPFLIQLMNFPYRYGTPFVAALYRDGGWAGVSAAYRRLPKSTEQILHPERYAPTEDLPAEINRSALPPRIAQHEFHYDLVLGEFLTRLVLEPHTGAGNAVRAAEGWDGDRAALYTGQAGDLLVWLSVWDSEEEAADFRQTLEKIRGTGIVQLRGARVVFVRGVEPLESSYLLEIARTLWEAWD